MQAVMSIKKDKALYSLVFFWLHSSDIPRAATLGCHGIERAMKGVSLPFAVVTMIHHCLLFVKHKIIFGFFSGPVLLHCLSCCSLPLGEERGDGGIYKGKWAVIGPQRKHLLRGVSCRAHFPRSPRRRDRRVISARSGAYHKKL